jgi:5-methylcytosine-specific restriction endonuclease McrA
MPRKPNVYNAKWRKVRKLVLERDRYVCKLRYPKCTFVASHVDHIVPVNAGGALYDLTNLRASCSYCNHYRNGLARGRALKKTRPSREW